MSTLFCTNGTFTCVLFLDPSAPGVTLQRARRGWTRLEDEDAGQAGRTAPRGASFQLHHALFHVLAVPAGAVTGATSYLLLFVVEDLHAWPIRVPPPVPSRIPGGHAIISHATPGLTQEMWLPALVLGGESGGEDGSPQMSLLPRPRTLQGFPFPEFLFPVSATRQKFPLPPSPKEVAERRPRALRTPAWF